MARRHPRARRGLRAVHFRAPVGRRLVHEFCAQGCAQTLLSRLHRCGQGCGQPVDEKRFAKAVAVHQIQPLEISHALPAGGRKGKPGGPPGQERGPAGERRAALTGSPGQGPGARPGAASDVAAGHRDHWSQPHRRTRARPPPAPPSQWPRGSRFAGGTWVGDREEPVRPAGRRSPRGGTPTTSVARSTPEAVVARPLVSSRQGRHRGPLELILRGALTPVRRGLGGP